MTIALRFSLCNTDHDFRCLHSLYDDDFSFTQDMTQSKKEAKDQDSIQSSTTPDPGYQWESDNVTIRHHKREPRGQSFPSR